MKLKAFLLAGFAALVLFGCKKKDATAPTKTNTELLTEKSWVVLKEEETINGLGSTDVFPSYPACEKDNKITFKTTFKVEESEGALACSPNMANQIITNVTWAFASGETSIVIDGDTYKIEKLDATNLVLYIEATLSGIKFGTKTTFGH